MNIAKKTFSQPLRIALIYSMITIFLYEFGPYKYTAGDRFLMYIFLLAVHCAMFIGYSKGINRELTIPSSNSKVINIGNIVNLCFWVAVVISIPKYVIFTGNYNFSIRSIIDGLNKALVSFNSVYVDKRNLASVSGIWKYINYVVVLGGLFYSAYMYLGIMYWKRLSLTKRIISILVWTLYILQYFSTGTNVGMIDFIIIFGICTIVKSVNLTKSKNVKARKARTVLLGIMCALLAIWVFSFIMTSRIGDNVQDVTVAGHKVYLNVDNFLWRMMPGSVENLLGYIVRYIAQPYNGLALSLTVPFSWTLGLGSSWFTMDNIPTVFGYSILEHTYNYKISTLYGYDYYSNWHTVYVWLANDYSFIGVPIVIGILFYLFAKSWKSYLLLNNIFAFLSFMLLCKFVCYIPANNQVFGVSDTMFAFWICLFSWRYTRNMRFEFSR